MEARGYWQAFQVVEKSIGHVLKGENPGTVAEDDHREWYREMFAPSVTAGMLKPADLAGYRNGQVYIRQSWRQLGHSWSTSLLSGGPEASSGVLLSSGITGALMLDSTRHVDSVRSRSSLSSSSFCC